MSEKNIKISRTLLIGIYGYLTLPIVIFLMGWCRWHIGIPAAVVVCISFWLCIKEHPHRAGSMSISINPMKCCIILLIVLWWVGLSGIGGYVWQNEDHDWRNAIFDLLVENPWPVTDNIAVDGQLQERSLIYYIGFWLPAALFGKLFGPNAGYAVQYVWAVAGILLFYALICAWRRKVVIWPLWVIIFFSGADAVGTLLNSQSTVKIFEGFHLERWARHYQFSCMTTQLFWVFNQAIPAWLVSVMIFLSEKPRNLIFIWSLIMVSSTLPFAGLLPFILFFLISRGTWEKSCNVPQLLKNIWKNWGSFQNVLGGGAISLITLSYLMGNISVGDSPVLSRLLSFWRGNSALLVMASVAVLFILFAAFWGIAVLFLHGKGRYVLDILRYLFVAGIICAGCFVLLDSHESNTYIYKLLFLFTFYMIEAGIYLICLKDKVHDQVLFWITAIWLLVIPLIKIGSSLDFCMRASIPALLFIMLWLIDALDTKKRTWKTWILIGVFLVGSITPLHELKRTYVNTRKGYEIHAVEKEAVLQPGNFSGDTYGIFWDWIAR